MNSYNDEIKKSIRSKGFFIYKKFIDIKKFKNIQDHWIDFFQNLKKEKLEDVIWQPFLGQKNKITFTKNETQCLYRILDFYWNEAYHSQTKELVLDLSDFTEKNLKNKPLNLKEYNSKKLGIYCSISHYPANKGFLNVHSDKLETDLLYHHMVPITFKHKHFDSGGLFIINKNNEKIIIDDYVEEGDVIFFDGFFKHGVDKIFSKNNIGRIQTFAITTNFKTPYESLDIVNDLKIRDILKTIIKNKIKKKI